MHIKIMAADNSMFVRGTSPKVFKACIGTCICIGDPKKFLDSYYEYFNEIKKKYSIKTPRNVFKTFDIKKLFSFEKHVDILEGFFQKICETPKFRMNFVWTSFKSGVSIKMYGGYTSKTSTITKNPPEFLDILNQYYPYICAWKTSKVAKLRETKVFLDNLTGEITRAWEELSHYHDIHIVPKGDQCNVFISASDLITNYIEYKMRERKMKLDENAIKKLLEELGSEEPRAYHCGVKDLSNIVPIDKKKISMDRYYIRPMVFVLKEGIFKEERHWIENSVVHEKLLNFANSVNGGLKYIDYAQDSKNIREGDYLVYLGEKGKEQARFIIERLGYPAKMISIDDI